MIRLAVLLALASLAGCAAPPSVQNVKVAVPVACKAEMPTRPAMPTDSVTIEPPKTFLFRFTRAAAAEIELREAYEQRLAAALKSCQ